MSSWAPTNGGFIKRDYIRISGYLGPNVKILISWINLWKIISFRVVPSWAQKMGGYKKELYPDIWKEVTMSVVFVGKEQVPCLHHEWCPVQRNKVQRIVSIFLKIFSIKIVSISPIKYVCWTWYHLSSKCMMTCACIYSTFHKCSYYTLEDNVKFASLIFKVLCDIKSCKFWLKICVFWICW